MRYREKSAWVLVSTIVVAYGWYLATVIGQLEGGSITGIAYQRSAIAAGIAVVVLLAVSHVVLAALGQADPNGVDTGTAAIKRYARSTGGVVITAGAVLGMALAMVEADYFWIANVILAGLVAAEMVSAGAEIVRYRRGA